MIKIKLRQNKLTTIAQKELTKRLKVSNGESKEEINTDKRRGNQIRSRLNPISPEKNFAQELIEPCDCNGKFHRICIREKIVTS